MLKSQRPCAGTWIFHTSLVAQGYYSCLKTPSPINKETQGPHSAVPPRQIGFFRWRSSEQCCDAYSMSLRVTQRQIQLTENTSQIEDVKKNYTVPLTHIPEKKLSEHVHLKKGARYKNGSNFDSGNPRDPHFQDNVHQKTQDTQGTHMGHCRL